MVGYYTDYMVSHPAPPLQLDNDGGGVVGGRNRHRNWKRVGIKPRIL